jgi:RNA polymerase sigma-70 factor (ECF subfamily)
MEVPDFGSLYQRYSRDVLRFALYLTGSRSEAEDIVSETFVRAWLSASPIRDGTVKSYLLAIARNLHIERHRHRARHDAMPDDLTDTAPGPEVQASGRDELRAVLEALQRLPEIDRSALLLRAQEGLTYTEIATALGLTVAAARVKVHRARLRLLEWRGARSHLHEDHS